MINGVTWLANYYSRPSVMHGMLIKMLNQWVDVSVSLMSLKSNTPKFTLSGLTKRIPDGCGVRSQSQALMHLDKEVC